MDVVLSDNQLQALLADDVPHGDLTSQSLPLSQEPAWMHFYARAAMTVCGTEEVARLCQLHGLTPELHSPSGLSVPPGTLLLAVQGTPVTLLALWKASQILLEWAAGLASATAEIVAAAGGVPVACTRKQTPGSKALSVKAVRAGGGIVHRLGLSESLLLFAEHRQFLAEAPEATLARLARQHPEQRRSVEVHDLDDARTWIAAGAEMLQLDKFSPSEVAQCVALCRELGRRPLIAAAGGVNAGNAGAYAAAGADLLVTSAPYWAKPRDVQVRFTPAAEAGL